MASPENIGFFRRQADRLAEASTVVDKFTIGIGIIMLSAPVIAFGILGLLTGNYIRDTYIRKK